MKPRPLWLRRWLAGLVCAAGCAGTPHVTLNEEIERHLLRPVTAQTTVEVARQAASPQIVPVGLDTVFRLAETQNPQIAQAREKVHESCLDAEVKAKQAHLPTVSAGLAYYRHEGGIQNEDGTLTHSSFGALFPGVEIRSALDLREAAFARTNGIRQQVVSRAELTKITSEILLDAASTYVDLLAARKAEVVVRESERFQREMLERAEKLAAEEPGAKILLEVTRAEVTASQQMSVQMHQQGDAAAAKLAYLLGLGCDSVPTPLDSDLLPLDLVDVTPPVDALCARVRECGPGVQELTELLGAIQEGIADGTSIKQFLPTVQLSAIEGGFAAGPGGSLSMDNRFDLFLAVKWNLTEYLTAKDRLRVAQSKLCQVEASAQELKNKLALAVREGRDTILASRERFRLATEQVRSLAEVYRLARLALMENVPGTKITDVLTAVRTLQQAHLAHIQTVQNHNKAQVRLLLLLGK
jgi:outer membrane protein TolC